ncbi:uncharacterized protein LOC105254912 isoform X2 [Camponotus floridanus]|uniref:uncharacterized protein LOC105254912 isoform X2 n=1 Tax=Camponotus floridanus TaxID=104421 RepID=UPI000DC68CEC|nr:uncharacterized protein LOC105254912 isoform X2 [Camponotus floridanus]
MEKLSLLIMFCLYCSIVNATVSSIVGMSNAVSPKCSTNTATNNQANQNAKTIDEEYDTLAIIVAEKSLLEILGQVSNIIKNSTCTGGHAYTLKREQKHSLEKDALNQSDSIMYYEDLLSCSENSTDEEEDSEPILGLWFEETLSLSDKISRNANKEKNNEASAGHIARSPSFQTIESVMRLEKEHIRKDERTKDKEENEMRCRRRDD